MTEETKRGLLDILEDLVNVSKKLIKEHKANREVFRYWMKQLIDMKTVVKVEINIPESPAPELITAESIRAEFERREGGE